jgi:hypothetical protein
MIGTVADLKAWLIESRETYTQALDMYERGQMRFVASNVDITRYQIANLKGIIANIDELLERMGADDAQQS